MWTTTFPSPIQVKMTLLVKVSLVVILLGFDIVFATFNFGSSIITIIEDNQGVFAPQNHLIEPVFRDVVSVSILFAKMITNEKWEASEWNLENPLKLISKKMLLELRSSREREKWNLQDAIKRRLTSVKLKSSLRSWNPWCATKNFKCSSSH